MGKSLRTNTLAKLEKLVLKSVAKSYLPTIETAQINLKDTDREKKDHSLTL